MNMYNEIILQIKSDKKCDLKDLIVIMKITAGTKNPYYISFPKTDQNGRSVLTKEDLISQFDDHLAMALMDYNGTIENAENTVELSLINTRKLIKNKKELLSWPLLPHEKKIWKTRSEELEYRLSNRNHIFNAKAIKIKLEKTNKILYRIKKVE